MLDTFPAQLSLVHRTLGTLVPVTVASTAKDRVGPQTLRNLSNLGIPTALSDAIYPKLCQGESHRHRMFHLSYMSLVRPVAAVHTVVV